MKLKNKKNIKLSVEQRKWVIEVKKALLKVDLHTQGKIKLKTAQQLLAEL